MKDLEQDLISQDIIKVCDTVAHYVLKKKTKQLIKFFLTQYNSFYLNDNLLYIHFVHDRINTLRSHLYSFTKRIVRITVCELFVMMSQSPRKSKITLMKASGCSGNQVIVVPPPTKFPIVFREKTISNLTFVQGLKRLCNIESTYELLIHKLLYALRDYDPETITLCLSKLFKYKTLIKINALKQQDEMQTLNVPDNFTSILCFICLSVCDDHSKREHCYKIIDLITIKSNFNMMLMAFNIVACPNFEQKYVYKNSFYFPITLQCTVKIGYVYEYLLNSEYKHLQKLVIEDALIIEKEYDDESEEEFDALFTIPELQHRCENNKGGGQLLSPSSYYDNDNISHNKIIIIRKGNSSSTKEKCIYNISKKIHESQTNQN